MAHAVDLFLDSGAFSAWSQKVEIDIKDYIEYVKENKDYIVSYANLDVIGSAEETWENQMIMEESGLKPIPIYHFKEDEKWLRKYLERDYEHIAFGGLVTDERSELHQWLSRMFDKYICNTPDRKPQYKVHGFGMTSLKIMLKYPWFSVDSTSWVLTGRFGSVFVPRKASTIDNIRDKPDYNSHNGYVYDANTWKIGISTRSPSNVQNFIKYADREDGQEDNLNVGKKVAMLEDQHYSSLSRMQQKEILEYFDHKGFDVGLSKFRREKKGYLLKDGERWFGKAEADAQRETSYDADGKPNGYVAAGWSKDLIVETVIDIGLANDYKLRDELNIVYFIDLAKAIQAWPWSWLHTTVKSFGMVR
jgi:hypothetical protein